MPNTLVHVAVQTSLFGPLRVPFTVVFAACVIPDMPWIANRLIKAIGVSLDPISSYSYLIAQASLFGCMFACIALGFLFRRSNSVSVFLFLGCLAHLLLDSLQVKWGNGVHLLAPYSWDILSLGFFEIDSNIAYSLVVAGMVPFLLVKKVQQDARLLCLKPWRIAACSVCIIAYFFVPAFFVSDVVESNSRYLQTLENRIERPGKSLRLDRETVSVVDGTWFTTTHIGEVLAITNPPAEITDGANYSFKAEFQDQYSIRLIEWKRHSGMRNIASYLGLLAIACWMTAVVFLSRRQEPDSRQA